MVLRHAIAAAIISQLLYFAAIITSVAAADSAAAACSLDLIWPPPDAIVLMGPDSKETPVASLKL